MILFRYGFVLILTGTITIQTVIILWCRFFLFDFNYFHCAQTITLIYGMKEDKTKKNLVSNENEICKPNQVNQDIM